MVSVPWSSVLFVGIIIAIAAGVACSDPAPVYKTTGDGVERDATSSGSSTSGNAKSPTPAKSKTTHSADPTAGAGGEDDGSSGSPAARQPTAEACIAAASSPGSGKHHPGEDCSTCHDSLGDRAWTVAGTLFDTTGNAVSGATIEVVDVNAQKLQLKTNDNGNFYTTTPVAMPLTVRASQCPSSSAMAGKVNAGSCNSCHDASNPIHL
jgi:hypothetical protein